MKIINAMFGRGLGGIEQAFLNASQSLARRGHEILSLTHPKAEILPQLEEICRTEPSISHRTLANWGQWDPLAAMRLKSLAQQFQPDIVLCHGNRANLLLGRAFSGIAPVVGFAHRYSLKHLSRMDSVIAVSKDLRQQLYQSGMAENQIFHIPNMINLDDIKPITRRNWLHAQTDRPACIGAMGRMVDDNKGFDLLIEALALLHKQDLVFQAKIAGDGPILPMLKARARQAGLENHLSFPGWIADKQKFFEECDLFCVPSRHEPFGIIVLDAWAHGVPLIATAAQGPSEMISDQRDGLLVPFGDQDTVISALADALARGLQDPELMDRLAINGLSQVHNYGLDAVGEMMETALIKIKNAP